MLPNANRDQDVDESSLNHKKAKNSTKQHKERAKGAEQSRVNILAIDENFRQTVALNLDMY